MVKHLAIPFTEDSNAFFQVETDERPKSSVSPCRDETKAADSDDANISTDENRIAAKQNPLAESEALNSSGVESPMASVDILGRDERMAAEVGFTNISRNEGGTAVKEPPPSKPEAFHSNTGLETAVLSATEKSAVELLYKRSQELVMCDELFLYIYMKFEKACHVFKLSLAGFSNLSFARRASSNRKCC